MHLSAFSQSEKPKNTATKVVGYQKIDIEMIGPYRLVKATNLQNIHVHWEVSV